MHNNANMLNKQMEINTCKFLHFTFLYSRTHARKMTPFSWFCEFVPPIDKIQFFAKMWTSMVNALVGSGVQIDLFIEVYPILICITFPVVDHERPIPHLSWLFDFHWVTSGETGIGEVINICSGNYMDFEAQTLGMDWCEPMRSQCGSLNYKIGLIPFSNKLVFVLRYWKHVYPIAWDPKHGPNINSLCWPGSKIWRKTCLD